MPPRPRAAGFTLVELLVTLGIVAVLLALGVGMFAGLRRKSELEATTSALRSLLRRARNAAREEGYPAVVELDAERSELRAQVRSPITRFRFEEAPPPEPPEGQEPPPYEAEGARGFRMTIERGAAAQGRTGQGLLFDEEHAWGAVPDSPVLTPLEGVHLRCWLQLGPLDQTLADERRDRPSAAALERWARGGPTHRPPVERVVDRWTADDPPYYNVVRKGRAYALGVTARYEVEVALTGTHPELGEVTWVGRTRADTLRPYRWYRLELGFDGRRAQAIVDGIPRALTPLPGLDQLPARLVRDRAPLVVSDPHPDLGLFGVLDELELAAYIQSQRVTIPPDLVLVASTPLVGFDLLGQLDPSAHAEAVAVYLSDDPSAADLAAGRPPAVEATGTRERRPAGEVRTDEDAFRRFAGAAGGLPPERVQLLVVERTGLVR